MKLKKISADKEALKRFKKRTKKTKKYQEYIIGDWKALNVTSVNPDDFSVRYRFLRNNKMRYMNLPGTFPYYVQGNTLLLHNLNTISFNGEDTLVIGDSSGERSYERVASHSNNITGDSAIIKMESVVATLYEILKNADIYYIENGTAMDIAYYFRNKNEMPESMKTWNFALSTKGKVTTVTAKIRRGKTFQGIEEGHYISINTKNQKRYNHDDFKEIYLKEYLWDGVKSKE